MSVVTCVDCHFTILHPNTLIQRACYPKAHAWLYQICMCKQIHTQAYIAQHLHNTNTTPTQYPTQHHTHLALYNFAPEHANPKSVLPKGTCLAVSNFPILCANKHSTHTPPQNHIHQHTSTCVAAGGPCGIFPFFTLNASSHSCTVSNTTTVCGLSVRRLSPPSIVVL